MAHAPRPRALVFGRSVAIVPRATALLGRIGFKVTLITPKAELQKSQGVARFIMVERPGRLAARAYRELRAGYDLVVAADDNALLLAKRLDVPLEEKLRLLPVDSERGVAHIASKIGLSRTLTEFGVATPRFAVAADRSELAGAASTVGYPVMVKADYGSGGRGVVRVQALADLERATASLQFPVLVQEFVEGAFVDCSGFFRNGALVTFSHSTIRAATGSGNGPSSVRRYRTRPQDDLDLVDQLQKLGRALDANGFASISAIQSSANGRLYFFEADMRPTVWTEYPKFFGADPAGPIAEAFGMRSPAGPRPANVPDYVDLAFLPRLSLMDIALNRYKCRTHFEDPLGRGIVESWLDNWVTENRLVERLDPLRSYFAPPKSR